MSRIGEIVSLVRQYGLRRCAYRAVHDAARRTGLLKRRFPVWAWAERPLAVWLRPGVPVDPDGYVAWRGAAGAPFFFAAGRPPRLRAEWAAGAIETAEAILGGDFPYFSGRAEHLGYPEPDWFLSPLTGRRAPADRHWCDRSDFEADAGDIKDVWEPSRFTWAYALVRAYAATGDERWPEAFWRLVESWMRANPPQTGPNWQCGQEVAVRAMACTFALQAFWASPAATPARVAALVVLLGASAERIARNIGYALAQRGNHATSEAAGLYTIGRVFPELKAAAVWRRLGQRVLRQETGRVWADGSYVQHSLNYERMALQQYAWCVRLAEQAGEPMPADTLAALARGRRFLLEVQDGPSGRVPNYGANDGALVLPLDGCGYLDYRPVLALLHYLLDRRGLYGPGPWQEPLLWLFGEEALAAPADEPRRASRDFAVGGYHTLRGRETWAMVRCHTFRNRPSQADVLHLDLWWQGVNVLRDSGSFRYYDPVGDWNRYFVSTAAHNTATVGGADQMVKGPRFQWSGLLRSRWLGHARDDARGSEVWEGEHDGYRRLSCRAVHRRAVCRLADAVWVVVDDVRGRGCERVDLHWHLADCPASAQGEAVRLETPAGPVGLHICADRALAGFRVESGLEDGERMGWESLYYARRTPAPTVRATVEGPLPVRLVTLVALGRAAEEVRLEAGGTALVWRIAGTPRGDAGAAGGRVNLAPPGHEGPIIRAVRVGDEPAWHVPWPPDENGSRKARR